MAAVALERARPAAKSVRSVLRCSAATSRQLGGRHGAGHSLVCADAGTSITSAAWYGPCLPAFGV